MNTPAPTHKQRNRGGRPRAENTRAKFVGARLTDVEREAIMSKIQASGLSRSEAIRLLLLHDTLPKKVYGGTDVSAARAYRNLQPLQSNLNQLAHHLNSNRTSKLSPDGIKLLWAMLKSLEKEVKDLRTGILSGEHPAVAEAS